MDSGELTVDVTGSARVTVRLSGRGTPLVALHCSGADGGEWGGLAEAAGGGLQILAPDLFGCGRSAPWSGPQKPRLQDYAAIVAALARRAGQGVHLVGHSHGGAVALRAAALLGSRIRSLVLVEPSCFALLRCGGARHVTMLCEIQQLAAAVRAGLAGGDHETAMGRFVDYWNGEGSWGRLSVESRPRLARQLGVIDFDFSSLLDDHDAFDDVAAIRCPMLVIRGDRSPAPSRGICELLADIAPSLTTRVIAGAGHMSPFSHRDQVHAVITEFAGRVRERRSAPEGAPAGQRRRRAVGALAHGAA